MTRRFVISLEVIAAAVMSTAMISCFESEPNTYLRSLRNVDKMIIKPLDSVSLSDIDEFLASNVVKAEDWLIMKGDSRATFHLLFYNINTREHFLALRKGRGPGEVIQPTTLVKYENRTLIYDQDKKILFEINIPETERTKIASMDTVAAFGEDFTKPLKLACCGKYGYITTNVTDPDTWYSYSDWSGNVLSSVQAFEDKDLSDDADTRMSHLLSSVMVSNPSGTKACVANIVFPAISFSSIEDGKLTEYKRYTFPAMGFRNTHVTDETIRNFYCLQADEKYVYALYSGNKLRGGSLPSWESQHLIVYDWSGEPVRHFILQRNITNFFLEGYKLYCDSSYPDFNVYVYDLEGYL